MIHKWLREGMSKSAIARRLGISRETVRKYALKYRLNNKSTHSVLLLITI